MFRSLGMILNLNPPVQNKIRPSNVFDLSSSFFADVEHFSGTRAREEERSGGEGNSILDTFEITRQ